MRFFLFISLLLSSTIVKSQDYLVNSEFLSTTPSFLLGLVPGIPVSYDVEFYKITYNTVDANGNSTIASGGISIPIDAECEDLPLVAYCHGTVLRQNDVPSTENLEGLITKVFAGTGYIAVAPDYIGLGDNAGFHPYVHAESQATATIDLIRATLEFIETIDQGFNGESMITGYSQGGHAAMAALKYAEDNDINDELGIIGGAPCSGPYNISDSQANVILSGEPYSNPGYIVYTLMSYELAYGNIYENLGDVIQSPYDELVLPYFDGEQDEFDMGVVNDLLPSTIDELLVDTVLANFESNLNHPIWVALRDNDNFDWLPQVPMRLFYCDGDEQVPFQNSIVANETMNANGALDIDALNSLPNATHGNCVIPALTDVFEFFTTLSAPCGVLGVTNQTESIPLNIYPNPSSGLINIEFPNNLGTLYIQNAVGKIVLEMKVEAGTKKLDLSELPAGLYFGIVNSESQLFRSRFILN